MSKKIKPSICWTVSLLGLQLVCALPDSKGEEPPHAAKQFDPWQPVRAVEIPTDPSGWAHGAIDCFIRAEQQKPNLAPAHEADRPPILRRVPFDCRGLPPL